MSAKITEARCQAFLAALRESGNQSLAAERAKVSRSWVQLHRARDPAFRRAMAEAVAQRRAEGERGECRPPDGWGFLDGVELVVRGNGGSRAAGCDGERARKGRAQIARARLRQWSPRAEERFLAALMSTCNVRAACAEVGLSPASAYKHRERWPAFARRWAAALKIGHARLECGVVEAACNLFSRPEEELPDVEPLRATTAGQAIKLLAMHAYHVGKIGKRPGRTPDFPDPEKLRASILRKIEAIERIEQMQQAGNGES